MTKWLITQDINSIDVNTSYVVACAQVKGVKRRKRANLVFGTYPAYYHIKGIYESQQLIAKQLIDSGTNWYLFKLTGQELRSRWLYSWKGQCHPDVYVLTTEPEYEQFTDSVFNCDSAQAFRQQLDKDWQSAVVEYSWEKGLTDVKNKLPRDQARSINGQYKQQLKELYEGRMKSALDDVQAKSMAMAV